MQPPQQRQQLLLEPGNPIAEVAVVIEGQQALGFFLRQQFDDACGCRLARMRDEQPQRTAVDRHQLDVGYDEAVTPAERLDRAHGVVAEVLVIDGVEFELGDEIADIGRLDDGNAVGLEQLLDAADEPVGIGNMREDVVGVDDVGELAFRREPPGKLLVEELDQRRDALGLDRELRDVGRRLDAEHRDAGAACRTAADIRRCSPTSMTRLAGPRPRRPISASTSVRACSTMVSENEEA